MAHSLGLWLWPLWLLVLGDVLWTSEGTELPGPGQHGLREELGSPPLLLSSLWEGKWGLQESALSGDLICASMAL